MATSKQTASEVSNKHAQQIKVLERNISALLSCYSMLAHSIIWTANSNKEFVLHSKIALSIREKTIHLMIKKKRNLRSRKFLLLLSG
jgi:hypothetical protein